MVTAAHKDTRDRYRVTEDRDHPPAKNTVVRVRTLAFPVIHDEAGEVVPDTSATYDPARVRVYLRTEDDMWVREDQVELDTAVAGIGIVRAIVYTWADLLDREQLLLADPRLIDADFEAITLPEWQWTVTEAEGLIGSAIRDIQHHKMGDEWGDFADQGPAFRLAMLDEAMGQLSTAVAEANERLRMVRLQVGAAANKRWKADLAAHQQRIEQANQDRLAGDR